MRKTILIAALTAIFVPLLLTAQAPSPLGIPLPRSLRPRPAPGSRPPHQPEPQSAQRVTLPAFDATSLGSPLILDKGWRVGISADPEAASPNFDDSQWAVRDAAATIQEVPDAPGFRPDNVGQPGGPSSQERRTPGQRIAGQDAPDQRGAGPDGDRRRRFAWFRMDIQLAQNHGPIALLIELPISRSTAFGIGATEAGALSVYANGKLVNAEGPHGSDPQRYQQISRIYMLDIPPEQTSLTLAIRTMHLPFGFNAYTNFFASRTLRLGRPEDLQRRVMVWNDGTLFERLPRLVYSIVLFVLAAFLFALYFRQRGHNEYLWLALHELVQAPIGFVELAGSTAKLDTLWYAALMLQLLVAAAYLFFEFLMSFLALKRRWYTQALRFSAPVLGLVAPTLLLVGRSTAIGIVLVLVFALSLLWLVCWFVFTFVTLIAATIRRNYEAGLLLIPLVLSVLGNGEQALSAGMNEFISDRALTFSAGPIPIHLETIADFLTLLSIVIIIFMRFLRIQEEQQHATSELAAARSVQELLIPQDSVATPGFEVDAVYSPATEVGGDFYHVQTLDDGGVLVVIGDVAGKGLQAAMNVSMIMGALRHNKVHSPAAVLTALNRVLTGNESFTTAQAFWFGEDGEVVIANAGHLPPYLNSQEVVIDGGLPLGVISEVSYDETRLYLHPGDRMLLFSDGVVEARKGSGELFGFERVHNLTNQSAFFIADAAKDFGQQDDITVVTVRRLAETVTEAASVKAGLGRLQAVERTAS